jgi:uncharacterized DUF497 family protein
LSAHISDLRAWLKPPFKLFSKLKKYFDKIKHGIDFYDAQELWNDSDLLEIPVKTSDEAKTFA